MSKKPTRPPTDEARNTGTTDARPLADVQREHSEALDVLKAVKAEDPRDAEKVHAQKLVVQALAAEIAAHETLPE